MPNINEAFPSKYLKASDFEQPALMKMGRTEWETIGTDRKLILYFDGEEKGLALNKTNANTIAKLYGENTEEWRGQQIVLFEAHVDFKGETVSAIRVRAPKRQAAPKPPADDGMNDSVPF